MLCTFLFQKRNGLLGYKSVAKSELRCVFSPSAALKRIVYNKGFKALQLGHLHYYLGILFIENVSAY